MPGRRAAGRLLATWRCLADVSAIESRDVSCVGKSGRVVDVSGAVGLGSSRWNPGRCSLLGSYQES